MALGTLTVISSDAGVGPLFVDNVSLVGDGSYPTGGSLGLLAKLRAAKKDQRAIISAEAYSASGYKLEYDPATDALKSFEQDAGGALGETANAVNLSGVTYKLTILSK